MSITVATLVARLQDDVAAYQGVPNNDQYERFVKDGVFDFGRAAGRVKRATLTLVAGTATYTFPTDFLRLVWLEPLDDMYLTGGYRPNKEKWVVSSGQITFSHDPYNSDTPVTYSGTRDYDYQAIYIETSNAYADLGEEEAGISLLFAKALALEAQADYVARQAWDYQVGDERVNKNNLAKTLNAQADAARKLYRERLRRYQQSQFDFTST